MMKIIDFHSRKVPFLKRSLLMGGTISFTSALIILALSPASYAKFVATEDDLLETLIDQVSEFKKLDLEQIVGLIDSIFNPPAQDDEVSQNIENKPDGSYDIDQDGHERQTIDSAYEYIEDTAFSEEAKNEQDDIAEATENNVESNQSLGEESQTLDVSQQILQNISAQMSLIGQQNGTLILQNQQNHHNQAWSNTLLAQETSEISQQNTKQRREEAATGSFTALQAGLMRPAGIPATSDNNTAQTAQPLQPNDVFSYTEFP